MTIDPRFGLPTQSDVFEEIAKGEQTIMVEVVSRRYGKKITLVSGFDSGVDLKGVSKTLKEKLACGGTVKDGIIELQGDHRKNVRQILVGLGFAEHSINEK